MSYDEEEVRYSRAGEIAATVFGFVMITGFLILLGIFIVKIAA